MSTITIYGASDDLIEIEGAISEEFDAYGALVWDAHQSGR